MKPVRDPVARLFLGAALCASMLVASALVLSTAHSQHVRCDGRLDGSWQCRFRTHALVASSWYGDTDVTLRSNSNIRAEVERRTGRVSFRWVLVLTDGGFARRFPPRLTPSDADADLAAFEALRRGEARVLVREQFASSSLGAAAAFATMGFLFLWASTRPPPPEIPARTGESA